MVKSEYEFALIYAAALAWLDLALAGPATLHAATAAVCTRWRLAGPAPAAAGQLGAAVADVGRRDTVQYGGPAGGGLPRKRARRAGRRELREGAFEIATPSSFPRQSGPAMPPAPGRRDIALAVPLRAAEQPDGDAYWLKQ
jgi:hypothetical protein